MSLQFSFGCQEIPVLEFLRLRYSAWIKVPGWSQRPRKSFRRKEVNKQDIWWLLARDSDDPFEQLFLQSLWFSVISQYNAQNSGGICLPVQILGRKVVIWYDRGAGKWQTFLDMCPHRLAPLSEGRIDEQGCLQCCYHGWSFKGDGSCARIPQALGEGPEAKAARKLYSLNWVRIFYLELYQSQGHFPLWPRAMTMKI